MLVITNSGAGSARAAAVDAAAEVLRSDGAEVHIAHCGSPADMGGILERRGSGPVVVAGGDGTLHCVVDTLYRQGWAASCDVGLLPLGTGNDFARGLGIPLEPQAAARALLRARPWPLDLLTDDRGGVAVNAVHVGAGAEASRVAGRWKRWLGPAAFLVGSVVAGFSSKGWHLRIETDGQELTDGGSTILMVGLANATPSIGGGTAALVPHAEPDDGHVDVMVSHATSLASRAFYAARMRRGTQTELPAVKVTRATTVTVHGHAFPINADGENSNATWSTMTWTVQPRAWRALLPEIPG